MKINKTKRRLLRSWTKVVSMLLAGIISVSFLSGCSSDELWDESLDDGDNVFETDEAYLDVTLTSTDNPRLLSVDPDDPDAISNAYFYFYDSDGIFVVQGEIDPELENWSEGSGNIDYSSNQLVILKGLTGKGYPKYVVTVLNHPNPDEFKPANNLTDMKKILSGKTAADGTGPWIYAIDNDGKKHFVMTTSSYPGACDVDDYYFATEIGDDYFVQSGETVDDTKSLQIYVERLAAKVTVDWDELDNTTVTTADERTLYKIDNDEGDPEYVELLGWKINGKARNSYLFKNLNPEWENVDLWTGWNDAATNFRCHWGMSYNYGADKCDTYPTSPNGNTTDDEANPDTWLNDYLEYVSLEDGLNSSGVSDYCAENTNTAGEGDEDVVHDSNSSALTGVLIKARLCDEDGNAITDKVGYTDGLMYYYIPIEHSLAITGSDPDDIPSEGDYGVVRNHHYNISITQLTDIGTGITDVSEVIIPESEDRIVGWEATALDWIVNVEDVDYGKTLDGYNKDEGTKGYIDVSKSND